MGYEDFVDIFLGNHKIGLYLGVISMHFRVLWASYRMGDIFYTKISNIFLGVLENPDILGVNGRCWAQADVWRKKLK